MQSEILLENKLYLIGNHNAVSKIQNNYSNLFDEYPLIYREEGSATRLVMENYLQRNGIQSAKKMQLTSNEAVKQAVIAGLGWSIMPIIGIRNEVESGLLKIIPMKGLPIQTTWQLIWLKEKKLSPIAESYLNYLAKEKDNIIQNYFALPSQK